jgi:hypothetical protein
MVSFEESATVYLLSGGGWRLVETMKLFYKLVSPPDSTHDGLNHRMLS